MDLEVSNHLQFEDLKKRSKTKKIIRGEGTEEQIGTV
jgi:hypothetical protein